MNIRKFIKSETRPLWLKLTILITPVVVIFMITGVIGVGRWYNESLKPLSIVAQENVPFVVEPGWNARDIGKSLQEKYLIRNATAFAWYVDREGLRQKLQAGTYTLNSAYSVPDIVTILTEGKIDTVLVTILPGQRLDQLAEKLEKSGYSRAEIDTAMKKKYDKPIFASKPDGSSIEGYIFPETYQLTSESTLEDLFTRAFDEFNSEVNDNIRKGLAKQGLTLHEGIILASMIEQEVAKGEDRPKVAQVFLKRLREDMVLGSDVTFFYAAAVDGNKPTADYDSPYNTRINKGLPPGPIGNFSISALEAVANPASTDYLYFVAGDDGNTYFSHTLEEHDENVAKHCKKLCELPE